MERTSYFYLKQLMPGSNISPRWRDHSACSLLFASFAQYLKSCLKSTVIDFIIVVCFTKAAYFCNCNEKESLSHHFNHALSLL